ncbi:MAG: replicative DNA helicase, partial [Candidatus Pacebacteria bacterium]|nr:replicative DNA helicase [Candidatus Paceibacterota bacterium]
MAKTYQPIQTMNTNLRVPPQNIDAEKALIGSIMVRPVGLNDIIDIIYPESYYVEKHRLIYQGMLELARKSEPIDLVSLSSKLREQSVLETIGGMAYLSELVSLVPASTNIEHYAHIVARKSTLRKLIAAGDTITQLGFDEGSELDEIMDQAEQSIMEITSNAGQGKKFVGIKEILPRSWESME